MTLILNCIDINFFIDIFAGFKMKMIITIKLMIQIIMIINELKDAEALIIL